MGQIVSILGTDKYVVSGGEASFLSQVMDRITRGTFSVAPGCERAYAEFLEVGRPLWQRYQDLGEYERSGNQEVYNPEADAFIIPAAWDDGRWDQPVWQNTPALQTVSRSLGYSYAFPVGWAADAERTLTLLAALERGSCASIYSSGRTKLILGLGVVALAGSALFAWISSSNPHPRG